MTESPAAAPKKLTAKQQAFIDAYFECNMNASAAARKAGYTNRANTAASQLMSNGVISAEIERLRRENTMPASEVLFRLTQHARGDIGEVWDEVNGGVDWAKARDKGLTGLIKKVKRKTTRLVHRDDPDEDVIEEEIEFHNPQVALQLLGKHHGLFVDKVEHTGANGGPIKSYMTWSPDDWDAPPDGS